MAKKPTLADVARLVGASGKSVSRVINGEPNVSAQLRDAVTRAVAELGYRPNLAARSLASARSRIIGVINPRIESAYFSAINANLLNACRAHGYHLMVEQIDTHTPSAVAQARRFIGEIDLAGIVLSRGPADSPEVCEVIASSGIPFVALSPYEHPTAHNAITVDNRQGEIELIDHLWSLGHRRYGLMFAPSGVRHSRGHAGERRLRELGCDPDAITRLTIDAFIPGLEAGRRIATQLTQDKIRLDALCAFNDEMAAGAIGHFLSQGISVPGDISVVGFDDSAIARSIWPQLTTIRQPLDIVADMAVTMLADRDFYAKNPLVTCPIELIVRQSTGPARR